MYFKLISQQTINNSSTFLYEGLNDCTWSKEKVQRSLFQQMIPVKACSAQMIYKTVVEKIAIWD